MVQCKATWPAIFSGRVAFFVQSGQKRRWHQILFFEMTPTWVWSFRNRGRSDPKQWAEEVRTRFDTFFSCPWVLLASVGANVRQLLFQHAQ